MVLIFSESGVVRRTALSVLANSLVHLGDKLGGKRLSCLWHLATNPSKFRNACRNLGVGFSEQPCTMWSGAQVQTSVDLGNR